MEEMDASEVDAAPPRGVRCRNVYFEETPAELITGGIIHEDGACAVPMRRGAACADAPPCA